MVIVSPLEYTESLSSGSSATTDLIAGPALLPKLPIRPGDVDIDVSEVSAAFFRFEVGFTDVVSTPTSGGVAPVGLSIVIRMINELIQIPD